MHSSGFRDLPGKYTAEGNTKPLAHMHWSVVIEIFDELDRWKHASPFSQHKPFAESKLAAATPIGRN